MKKTSKQKNCVVSVAVVTVDGMSCKHCKARVTEILSGLDGVENVTVDLDKKTATLNLTENVADDKICSVINDAGYKVVKIER